MKKILISILIVLLLVLAYIIFSKGLNINFIKISSFEDIKNESIKLDEDFNKANELSNITYPAKLEGLNAEIRKLKSSKENYDNSKISASENEALGTVEIKTYAIHYLWTILGNYRADDGVKTLTLDLKSTNNKDVYDLGFTLTGNYVSITDFIYDIEDDEQLKFEIKDFSISSSNSITEEKEKNTETNETENKGNLLTNNDSKKQNQEDNKDNKDDKEEDDGIILQATFTVENVGITLE